MVEQPSGTVSFFFSDIEGSTRLLHALGAERYSEQLERHRAFLRERFEAHAGYEVHTEGDAFFVAFRSASHAVEAAREVQQALAAADWPDGHAFRVRIGIHTGEPVIVPPNYVGIDVHKAARIMAAGHGGQVLLSEATRRLLDARFYLRDLGEHRLKDLLQPERLYQLAIPGVSDSFPPLRTLEGKATNLPAPISDFIGRTQEVEAVLALLREGGRRLVTLTGVGGVGKTRVALRAAADLLDEFDDGVFQVALSAVRDEMLVLAEISKTLAIAEEDGRPLAETLAQALAGKKLLLLLDSFDRVRSAAPHLARLLESCPQLTVLVTSRIPLGMAGELVYPVPPLGGTEALDLLVTRAQALGIRLEPADPALVTLVERVEHLPLALELAAGRLQILRPAELVMKIEEAIFESGRLEYAPTRQQTIRSMIDWSHELMSEAEQQLFARLSVFTARAPITALEEICGADLETLSSLVIAGFVRKLEGEDGQARFVLPAIVRSYARERLRLAGEEPTIARAHAVHYLAVARRTGGLEHDVTPETEQGNYWAALEWAKEHDHALAEELGRALGDLFHSSGRVQEEHTVIAAIDHLRRPQHDGSTDREASIGPETATGAGAAGEHRGPLRAVGNNDQAAEQLQRALQQARDEGDNERTSSAAVQLGCCDLQRGQHAQALRSLLIGLRLVEADPTSPWTAPCLEGFAALAAVTGELVHAARMQGAASSFPASGAGEDLAATLRQDTRAAIVATLGFEHYERARQAGAILSLNEAAAEARSGTAPG
jgi:predicted ATPase/class 3 adenylate cyclase